MNQLHEKVNLVHIGNSDRTNITQVAHLIAEVLALKGVELKYTGGKKGWKGDAFTNFITSDTLDRLGWKAKLNTVEAVKEAARRLAGK